jgi:hypothetical protein
MTTRRSAVLWLTVAVVATAFAACNPSRQRTVPVTAESISPAPGSTGVSRRIEMRVVFDRDVDPASIDSGSCRITQIGPLAATGTFPVSGQPPILIPSYDAAARLLTLQPLHPLVRNGIYRIELTTRLRVSTGEAFARPITWELTTDATPVFDVAFDLDAGTLLACEPSRRGGALVVLAAPDQSLMYRRYENNEWLPARFVGISDVIAADVADDTSGRVVVAAVTRTGQVRVATCTTGPFSAPEDLGTTGSEYVDVDASASGHTLLATYDGLATGIVRSQVPSVGWTAPFSILGGLPHVRLNAAGDGIAVAAITESLGGGSASTGCWRFCVDALGNWSQCDPTLPPGSVALPIASRAVFRDDRVLLASTGAPPLGTGGLFERRGGVWQNAGVPLGSDPDAISIAMGPMDVAAATTVLPGLRPILFRRLEVGFAVAFLSTDEQPAPNNPTTAVGITDDFTTNVLWTAKVDDSDGAPVRLMAASLPAVGKPGEQVAVDGPFASGDATIQKLRVVTSGMQNAIAVWSRAGIVRFANVR